MTTTYPGARRETAERRRRGLFSRRRLLQLAASGLAAAGSGALWAFGIEPHWVEIVERDLPIDGLPEGLIGKRLVQISDLHIGAVVDDEYMSGALERVARLEPDVVVVTGDFMTSPDGRQIERVERILAALEPHARPTLAVLGNHDYGRGWRRSEIAGRLTSTLERLGVRVLRNEIAEIEGLHVAGLDDFWGPRFDPHEALRNLPESAPAIALSHNPDSVDQPGWNRFRGWILSGHTHGGQVKPPFLPPPILPVRNRRYTSGEFALSGGRRLWINRGLGYLWRVRFNARPEVNVFRLVRSPVPEIPEVPEPQLSPGR